MSQTTVLVVGRDGEVHYGRSFPNSWWSAWFIWRWLWLTYTGTELDPAALQLSTTRAAMHALMVDARLSPAEQIALGTTLDYAMIRRGEALWVADALDAFAKKYERRHSGRGVTTLPLQAAYLREQATNPEVSCLCWQQTTVLADFWVGPTGSYNTRYGTLHWLLFDRYPHLRPPA